MSDTNGNEFIRNERIRLAACPPAQTTDPVPDLEQAVDPVLDLEHDSERMQKGERLQGIARLLAIGAARAVSKGGAGSSPAC